LYLICTTDGHLRLLRLVFALTGPAAPAS